MTDAEKKVLDEEVVVESVDVEVGTMEDVDAIMKKFDRESNTRVWEGTPKKILRYVLAAFMLFMVYMNLWATWSGQIRRCLFVGFVILFTFFIYPVKKGNVKPNSMPWYDILLAVAGCIPYFYYVANFKRIVAMGIAIGQTEVIRRRIAQGVPFLGICLGEHLLFEEGVEGAAADGNPRGLGVLPGCVDRMPRQDAEGRAYKVPHMGWNTVDFPAGAPENPLFAGIPSGTYFYFTHSYIAPDGPFAIVHTTHSVTFPCAVQKGNAFGVQFHPEKSSDAGAAVLRRDRQGGVARLARLGGRHVPAPRNRYPGRQGRSPGERRLQPGDRVQRRSRGASARLRAGRCPMGARGRPGRRAQRRSGKHRHR